MKDFNQTDIFSKSDIKNEYIKEVLNLTLNTLEKKGYDPVNQLIGYLKTENVVYIPRDNSAREKISKLSTEEILEVLIKNYIEVNK